MKLSSLFHPPPVKARHVKRTFVSSPDDERSQPNRTVIETTLDAVRATLDVDIGAMSERMKSPPHWPEIWPGEHYRLLAGFVAHLQPRTVVEIGTETGLSALCLKTCLPVDGKLVTFDLIQWDDIPHTCLVPDDFADGRLTQVLANLADPEVFQAYAGLLADADLMFADGPKDGKFEPAFFTLLEKLPRRKPLWILFDDIRDMNMLQFWRDIKYPKLDISSFGHWTGTGLVHWGGPA